MLRRGKGEQFLAYEVPKERKVLFIDGEMPASDLKARFSALGAGNVSGLFLMPSETLHLTDRPLNIQSEQDQQRIVDALQELKETGINIEVLIFDNLSSLSYGVDENDNTEQEAFLRWLMHLRHMGYAVILVHHAGKSGDQRGASRREDLLDTVIKLQRDDAAPRGETQGAHFAFSFTKTRGKTPKPYALLVSLMPGLDGVLTFATQNSEPTVSRMIEALKIIHDKNPKTVKALAEIMEVSSSAVSQHKNKLQEKGLLRHTNNGFQVTEAGRAALARRWPQEYAEISNTSGKTVDASADEDDIPF